MKTLIAGYYSTKTMLLQIGNKLGALIRLGIPWACDNAAYSNPSDEKFERMVWQAWEMIRFFPPDWIAVPDVVGDHRATLIDTVRTWQRIAERQIADGHPRKYPVGRIMASAVAFLGAKP